MWELITPSYFSSGGFIDHLIKGSVHFQVENISTVLADHMVMRVGPAVKPVAAVRGGDLDDLADICQQIQVAVNRAQADIWNSSLTCM